MPSFDITSKVDLQVLDNVVNVVKKIITNRFDFKDNHVVVELNKKDFQIELEGESEMKLDQIVDVVLSSGAKQGILPLAFDLTAEAKPSGKIFKKKIAVSNGLKQDDAKKIVKAMKEHNSKIQAQIMDDIIRVTSKKIDELQAAIAFCKTASFSVPLQFVNMK